MGKLQYWPYLKSAFGLLEYFQIFPFSFRMYDKNTEKKKIIEFWFQKRGHRPSCPNCPLHDWRKVGNFLFDICFDASYIERFFFDSLLKTQYWVLSHLISHTAWYYINFEWFSPWVFFFCLIANEQSVNAIV